ncbi:11519_t:CDS:2, partial [Funneliformis geosporum]
AKNDEGLTAILDDALSSHQEIPFMAIDNEGLSEKINGKHRYVLYKESSDECEIKVKDILSSSKVETIKIKHIRALSFRAMKAIQDNNYKTASDDLYSFYRKVVRENGIQLFGWSML